MATRTLAQWAVELSTLPPAVETAARRSLYNYIGCAIAGSTHPAVSKAHAALRPFFGAPTSTVLGHRGHLRLDAPHAALLNGIASHVHDYDDTHLATIIHPTGPVASAILAFAELQGDVSGSQLLLALVAGIEASCKTGLAVWPAHYDIGWHITSTTGSIGAAVAVAKLMRLTPDQTAHAIGLAAVQVTGLREMFGSDTKAFHPGRAAQNGLLAAVLAQQGYTSSLEALEARRGWANVVAGGGEPRLERFVAELGQTWETEANAFKPFPCGIVCHPAMDAAIQISHDLRARGESVEAIDKVNVRVHPLVMELTAKKKPRDGLEGKFSVFHGCAVSLLYGKAGPAEYDDAVVTNPAVIAVRDKVDAVPDESLTADAAHMIVHLNDGQTIEKQIHHAVGSREVPMTDSQLSRKFIDQCVLVLSDDTQAASDAAWSLGSAQDVSVAIKSL